MRRRSTAGTTPAFPILNTLGFTAYSVSTLSFYFSGEIQRQYRDRNNGEGNTVRGNDVAFGLHALLLSSVTLTQFWPKLWGFERRVWRVGNGVWGIVMGCGIGIAWTVGLVARDGGHGWQWIDVVYAVGYVKLLITVVKYMPQVWANYQRQSTVGWSIEQILMDLLGGVLSIAQLVIDSSLQRDWSGLIGNPVKFGLGNVSILFDVIFMTQHYILYNGVGKAAQDGVDGERDCLLAREDEEAAIR
ncbi:MAG: hypothetical protein Q9163_005874 [Psora crenata]